MTWSFIRQNLLSIVYVEIQLHADLEKIRVERKGSKSESRAVRLLNGLSTCFACRRSVLPPQQYVVSRVLLGVILELRVKSFPYFFGCSQKIIIRRKLA